MTDFLPSIAELFRECFEGVAPGKDYTWFVQGKEGIFDALASVSAVQASQRPTPSCASIAAHAYHIRFALRSGNSQIRGFEVEGTWESSWEKQSVTDAEWSELASDIREEYDFFLGLLRSQPEIPGGDAVIGTLAQLPHMAYHLGAIRQLMKLVE